MERQARDHALTISTTPRENSQPAAEADSCVFDNWFDRIEADVRDRVREFLKAMIEEEPAATLVRPRYGRLAKEAELLG